MAHLYLKQNEYLLHPNLVLMFVDLSSINNKYWTLKHFDNIYMSHNETIISNQIRLIYISGKHKAMIAFSSIFWNLLSMIESDMM
jgi:hypothetical protein